MSKAAANKEAYALLQSMSIELMEKVDQILHGSNQSKDIPQNHEQAEKQAEKQPAECNNENVVQAQGIKRKEKGNSSKRIKSGLELNSKNTRKKGMV